MRLVRLAFLLLLFARAAAAQTTGTLEGVVIHAATPIQGATIAIRSPALQGERTAVTDRTGRFRFTGLPPGRYTIGAWVSGMTPAVLEVTVGLGQTASVTVQLGFDGIGANTGPGEVWTIPTMSRETVKPPFTIVRVFYGTNRTRIHSPTTKYDYDGRPTDLNFGMAMVSIPRDHRVGDWEKPPFAALARQDEDVMLLTVIPRTRGEFTTDLRTQVAKAKRREAFVFVHGFKTSFADAIQRTALLAYDLEFKGVPITFVWPSRADFFRYTSDEDAAVASIEPLEQFLELVARESKAERIHLIAHSMGNRVMLEALKSLEQRNAAPANLANLIFTAPDVNIIRFRQLLPQVRPLSKRTTVYASSRDKALLLSQWLHDFDRAGQGGEDIPVFAGVDSIDVTAIDRSLISHSYHADNTSVIADLHALINTGKPPSQRKCLSLARRESLPFWIFRRPCAP